jgi:hypothetical protein
VKTKEFKTSKPLVDVMATRVEKVIALVAVMPPKLKSKVFKDLLAAYGLS